MARLINAVERKCTFMSDVQPMLRRFQVLLENETFDRYMRVQRITQSFYLPPTLWNTTYALAHEVDKAIPHVLLGSESAFAPGELQFVGQGMFRIEYVLDFEGLVCRNNRDYTFIIPVDGVYGFVDVVTKFIGHFERDVQ